jgi:hypothetical protein
VSVKQTDRYIGSITAGAFAVTLCASAQAETVDVKYRGPVDLKPFTCTNTVSSFVNRVCYDKVKSYMLILLKDSWYHYCEIDERTVASLINADSVGRFFNQHIKGTGRDGPFDCRTHRVPSY